MKYLLAWVICTFVAMIGALIFGIGVLVAQVSHHEHNRPEIQIGVTMLRYALYGASPGIVIGVVTTFGFVIYDLLNRDNVYLADDDSWNGG